MDEQKELEKVLDENIKNYKRLEALVGGNMDVLKPDSSPILYKEKMLYETEILKTHKKLKKKFPKSDAIKRVKWIPKGKKNL